MKRFALTQGRKEAVATLLCLVFISGLFLGALFVIDSKGYVFSTATNPEEPLPPFPVSVNPITKHITEVPFVGTFESIDGSHDRRPFYISWLRFASEKLAQYDWYQSLAAPRSRILIIREGERREQVVDNFGDIMKWNVRERATFEGIIVDTPPLLSDGKFYPGRYLVDKDATPESVARLVLGRFNREVAERYTSDVASLVPIETALTVASLLVREAAGEEDIREISGIIWNRVFIDMPLQIDATLQYAKGTNPHESWWPKVVPDDKYINSVYNTYENKGLPPSPIANAESAALIAALNPIDTECLYYFHNDDSEFFCSVTYEEHVEKLIEQFGRGK